MYPSCPKLIVALVCVTEYENEFPDGGLALSNTNCDTVGCPTSPNVKNGNLFGNSCVSTLVAGLVTKMLICELGSGETPRGSGITKSFTLVDVARKLVSN